MRLGQSKTRSNACVGEQGAMGCRCTVPESREQHVSSRPASFAQPWSHPLHCSQANDSEGYVAIEGYLVVFTGCCELHGGGPDPRLELRVDFRCGSGGLPVAATVRSGCLYRACLLSAAQSGLNLVETCMQYSSSPRCIWRGFSVSCRILLSRSKRPTDGLARSPQGRRSRLDPDRPPRASSAPVKPGLRSQSGTSGSCELPLQVKLQEESGPSQHVRVLLQNADGSWYPNPDSDQEGPSVGDLLKQGCDPGVRAWNSVLLIGAPRFLRHSRRKSQNMSSSCSHATCRCTASCKQSVRACFGKMGWAHTAALTCVDGNFYVHREPHAPFKLA